MKHSKYLFFVMPLLLLTACAHSPTETSESPSANPDDEVTAYQEAVDLAYFGIENKLFNYDIQNDTKKICKINDNKRLQNGDTVILTCGDDDADWTFEKKIELNNLLEDDLASESVQRVLSEQAKEFPYLLAKQEDYGFALILVKEEGENYRTDIYPTVFLHQKDLINIEDFSPEKIYAEEDFQSLEKPPVQVTSIKKADLKGLIAQYEEVGYILIEEK